jgi:hypothetical protein
MLPNFAGSQGDDETQMQQIVQMQHMHQTHQLQRMQQMLPMQPAQVYALPIPVFIPVHHPPGVFVPGVGEYMNHIEKGKGRKNLRRHQMQEAVTQSHLHSLPAGKAAHVQGAQKGKGRQSTKSFQMQEAVTQQARTQDSMRDESEDQKRRMLLEALTSLYEDQIMPVTRLVLRRIDEKYRERWSSKQLLSLCGRVPEIKLAEGSQIGAILLRDPPKDFEGFADQAVLDDPYPLELWFHIKAFLEEEVRLHDLRSKADAPGWPGSRYEFAKWMRSRLKWLSDYSLGQVCHMVHLCVSKRELLGYHRGDLVPFQLSENCRRKSHALLKIPSQIRPGESYAQTWEQARDLIVRVLEQHGGKVPLACLKKLCRSTCSMELNECALGHTKLTELLQDDQLKFPSGGSFAVEVFGTEYHVVHKKSKSSKALPQPAGPQLDQTIEMQNDSGTDEEEEPDGAAEQEEESDLGSPANSSALPTHDATKKGKSGLLGLD